MGFLRSLFSSNGITNLNIDRAIEHLGQEGSIVGTAYREISYKDVAEYIKTNDCRITLPSRTRIMAGSSSSMFCPNSATR